MKTVKPPRKVADRQENDVPSSVLPPESRRSTGAALLKHAPGWAGDDLQEVLQIVTGTRTKTRF
jgi:hypothetical protein